jgi:SAM-dependent MidA family methyltransferase
LLEQKPLNTVLAEIAENSTQQLLEVNAELIEGQKPRMQRLNTENINVSNHFQDSPDVNSSIFGTVYENRLEKDELSGSATAYPPSEYF